MAGEKDAVISAMAMLFDAGWTRGASVVVKSRFSCPAAAGVQQCHSAPLIAR